MPNGYGMSTPPHFDPQPGRCAGGTSAAARTQTAWRQSIRRRRRTETERSSLGYFIVNYLLTTPDPYVVVFREFCLASYLALCAYVVAVLPCALAIQIDASSSKHECTHTEVGRCLCKKKRNSKTKRTIQVNCSVYALASLSLLSKIWSPRPVRRRRRRRRPRVSNHSISRSRNDATFSSQAPITPSVHLTWGGRPGLGKSEGVRLVE